MRRSSGCSCGASQVQPLLVVFEDLHGIDSETQAILNYLVDSLPLARMLLLVSYRPEYRHDWQSKPYYTQVRLGPLEADGTENLLDALLGHDVDASAAEAAPGGTDRR